MEQGFRKKIFLSLLMLILPALLLAELDFIKSRFEPVSIATLLAPRKSLSIDEMVDAALVFSGIDENKLDEYRGKMSFILEQVKNSFVGREPGSALADELLQFLHKHYLKKYKEFETELDVLLDKGFYNCVSSSVFYMIAAQAVGINVVGIKTKDHAFLKVALGGKSFDIETTSTYGFDPGTKKEFMDEFGATTGYVYAPPSNYRDRKDIGSKELISLILRNRIVKMITAKKYELAVGCAVDLFEFQKDDEALEILIGIFSQISQHALGTAQFETGYRIIDRAVMVYREFTQLLDLRRYYVAEWARILVEKSRYDDAVALAKHEHAQGKITLDDFKKIILFRYQRDAERLARDMTKGSKAALDLIEEGIKELGNDESLLKAEKVYAHNWALDLIDKSRFDEAYQFLTGFYKMRVSESEYKSIYVYYIQKRAEQLAKKEDFEQALLVVEKGMSVIGNEKTLVQHAAVYLENHIINLYRQQAFEKAKALLESERGRQYLSQAVQKRLTAYYFLGKAEQAKNTDGYPAALGILREGLKQLGSHQDLLKQYQVLAHNYMIIFFDRKAYDEAEGIVIEALAIYPASVMLKKDLETIRKAKNR